MEPVVIYHKSCFDGFGAAWVFESSPFSEGAVYVPAAYGDEPPYDLIKDKNVIIVDFSYPREQMNKILLEAGTLTVLDHHKTAEAALKDFPGATFDMTRSGAMMMADWIEEQGFEARNWLVEAVQDRDLWTLKLPGTKEIIAVLASHPFDFDVWNRIFDQGMVETIRQGEGILHYIENYGKKASEHVVFRSIAGHVVPVINVPYMNCSDHLDYLKSVHPTAPFVASFFLRGDGLWQFSLRCNKDFDVSEIAKQFGGGGHKQASGFQVSKLPWE